MTITILYIVLFLLSQLLITASGSGLLSLIGWRGKTSIELICVSFLVGITGLSVLLFVLLIATVPLSSMLVWGILLTGTGTAGFLAYRGKKTAFLVEENNTNTPTFASSLASMWIKTSLLKKILFVLMAASLLFKLIMALWFVLSTPPYFDDAIVNWNIRGKAIFYEHGIYFDKTRTDVSFVAGGTFAHYPLLAPIVKAGEAAFMGEWKENYLNTLHLFTFIAFIGIFWAHLLRKTADLFISLLFPFLFASSPVLFFHTFSAFSDLLVGILLASSLLFFVEWVEQNTEDKNGSLPVLVLSGILLFGACSTKNEGLVIGFTSISAAAFFFAVKEKNWRYLIPSATAFILLLPSTVIRILFDLPLNPVPINTFSYHDGTFVMILDMMVNWGHHNIFWYAAPLFLLFFLGKTQRNKPAVQFAGIAVAVFISMLVFTFGWTSSHAWLVNQTTINRSLMQYSASFIVFLSLLIPLQQTTKSYRSSKPSKR